VAEGGVLGAWVIDAHPAMRRIAIPVKTELIRLGFIVSKLSVGFYRVGFSQLSCELCQADDKMHIGL
jgi:hypothetical protein